MAHPPSQKHRAIGFVLSGGGDADVSLDLTIRPEDLTYSEPTRLTVQQTLGGAWADCFGEGVATLTLAGHLGWRGGHGLSGEAAFAALRATIYQGWNDRVQAAVNNGIDPATITLTYHDALDGLSLVVAPMNFTLRRNKQQPLLMKYQTQLIVLNQAAAPTSGSDPVTSALGNPQKWQSGVSALANTTASITSGAAAVAKSVGSIAGQVGSLIKTGAGVLGAVGSLANSLKGDFTQAESAVLSVGSAVAKAAANGFAALAANDAMAILTRAPLMQAASDWNDAYATISNAFNVQVTYPTYAALAGAGGGSQFSGGGDPSQYVVDSENPWNDVVPFNTSQVSVSPAALAAMQTLSGDPLDFANNPDQVGPLLGAIGSGVTINGDALDLVDAAA
jgi:hypothetical protein